MYAQAFDGTICTDSIRSFTLVFLIMLTICLVGMVMIMTRSAMYPYKMVFSSPSPDGDDDEWEEYQAYLQYMASFVNMCGVYTDDEFSVATKLSVLKDSHETSVTHAIGDSSTVSSNHVSPDDSGCESPQNRRDPTSFYRPQEKDYLSADEEDIEIKYADEERTPLSPAETKTEQS